MGCARLIGLAWPPTVRGIANLRREKERPIMIRFRNVLRSSALASVLAAMLGSACSGSGAEQPAASVQSLPVVTGCHEGTTQDSSKTITFSSKLEDPAFGALTLDATVGHGSAVTPSYSVKLNGNPFYEILTEPTEDGSTRQIETYFAPANGVHQVITTSKADTIIMLVDGRRTLAAPAGAKPEDVRFEDGQPAPKLVVAPELQDGVKRLLTSAATDSASCFGQPMPNQSVEPGKDPLALAHPSSGLGCNTCESGCRAGYIVCIVGAISGCGPFSIFCGAGCAFAMDQCMGICHRSGTDCCPVGCGGESGSLTPIGTCCMAGDICLKRGDSAHSALCCPGGTTTCGGRACCNPGETCMPGGTCCPVVHNGECCFIGTCTTKANCNNGNPNGPNGCDANGCCFVG